MSTQAGPGGFRTFLILWLTQSVSLIGNALSFFAISIWMAQSLYPAPEQKGALAMALSTIALARTVPMLAFAPVAGAWADRSDRKRALITADLGSGLITLIMVGMLVTGSLQLWSAALLIGLHAICDSFHQAAFDTSYSLLVPREMLPRANGMMQTVFSLSGILAPGISAFLISLPGLARQGLLPGGFGSALGGLQDGVALAIGLDSATFFLSAVVLGFLRIPSPARAEGEGGRRRGALWADIQLGIRFLRERPPLLWLLLTFAVGNLLYTPTMLFVPLLAKFNLAADWSARGLTFEAAMALLGTLGSLGGLAGGILISLTGGLKGRRVYGVVIPFLLLGAAQIFLGLSPWVYLAGAMLFLASAQGPIANAHSQSIWQTQTPPDRQGRVFAVRRVIAQITTPIMTALAGWAGGLFNPGHLLVLFGALLLLFSALQLFNARLLEADGAGAGAEHGRSALAVTR